MGRVRFTTAGESHGKALVAILEGMPAGLPLVAADVDHELGRRMQGYGRGARMKIEQDRVEFLAGVRAGATLGSPIAMHIPNRDWDNWRDVMAAEPDEGDTPRRRRVERPRPGHADLAGALKYGRDDARDILERASARETAARVAAGAVARRLLGEFGVEIGSHVVSIGPVAVADDLDVPVPLNPASDASPVRCLDSAASQRMIEAIDAAKKAGDTLGGVIEVIARGVPVGLGSHVSWDRKLDGRLARALMSIHAIKGVEIGLGFEGARRPGSQVHDPIQVGGQASSGGFARTRNGAGGLEGGITNGEPLATVNLRTGETAQAQSERSDVTAVPAAGVIAEAMMALVLADALMEKFGGDSLDELRRNVGGYLAGLDERQRLRGSRDS